jgi:hypothetical protein
VTISGRNYSGAAGQLSVWFGPNQVPAIVTDDAHVTAIAPSGSGTVDVRVQSGLSSANSSANYTRPIWGYGLSVPSSVAHFTYQSLDPFHAWLASYGLPSDSSADYLNSDGDGLNNWQEYLAGTNPTNASSVFRITGGQAQPGGQFVLSWLSVSNRFYDVLCGTNVATGACAFLPVPGATNLAGTPPENTWTDSVSSGPPRVLFRITAHQ